ncbi:MAG: hypothetical protein HONDAALG_01043 [Gammaproteobacteria bacterium]|nr:hypothetical protein [Gammaproteobacteria bacterium]
MTNGKPWNIRQAFEQLAETWVFRVAGSIPWNRWYAFTHYVKSSLWVVPFFAVLLYMIMVRTMEPLTEWLGAAGWIDAKSSFLRYSLDGAQVVLEAIITFNISFLVFTFGSLLVAIQVAGGQYTPRIIATTLLRDNAIRFTVAYFIFVMFIALRVRTHLESKFNQLDLFIVAMLGLASVVLFLYLIDYAARMLRPVSIVARLAEGGIKVIDAVYPEKTRRPTTVKLVRHAESPRRVVPHAGMSGNVIAVNIAGLVTEATRVNGLIEIVPQVGDFVAVDEPLFLLYGGAESIGDRILREQIVFGSERTIEQDPTFAFRVLVDIALKALSAAINDPTTAVLAIDQLHRLLRMVGLRHLRDEAITDSHGGLRVVLRTPNWVDFVHLTFREIRHCGASSVQIARRLRAMAENLMQTLPEHRHKELLEEVRLLDSDIDSNFALPEDRALARIADAQGLGGSERKGSPVPVAADEGGQPGR